MFFKTVALTVVIAGLGTSLVMGAANAATPTGGNMPLCSRSVADNCMNPSQAPNAERHAAIVHRASHHATKVASKTAKSTTMASGTSKKAATKKG